MTDHIHDCTGPDMTCSCGFVFRVPPVFVSLTIGERSKTWIDDGFNTESMDSVPGYLREIADRLERELRTKGAAVIR